MPKASTAPLVDSHLARLRKKAGFSQQQLADAVSALGRMTVSWRHIYRLEKTGAAPGVPLAQELALILGTSINRIWKRKC